MRGSDAATGSLFSYVDLELRVASGHPLRIARNQYDTGKARRRSALDARTARHPGHAVSQRIRKRIEEVFGWLKTVAGWQKSRFRRRRRTEYGFIFARAADNLTRMPKILAAEATA